MFVSFVILNFHILQWAERGSPNMMKAYMVHGGKPWTADPDHEHYRATARATKHVYKVNHWANLLVQIEIIYLLNTDFRLNPICAVKEEVFL